MLKLMGKTICEYLQIYAQNFCLSKPMNQWKIVLRFLYAQIY